MRRRFHIGLSKIHRRLFRIGSPKIHRRFRIGPQVTLNLLLPEFHSCWILVYHGYYVRKATKLPIWNRMVFSVPFNFLLSFSDPLLSCFPLNFFLVASVLFSSSTAAILRFLVVSTVLFLGSSGPLIFHFPFLVHIYIFWFYVHLIISEFPPFSFLRFWFPLLSASKPLHIYAWPMPGYIYCLPWANMQIDRGSVVSSPFLLPRAQLFYLLSYKTPGGRAGIRQHSL